MNTYVEHLENNLFELVSILTHDSLWSFLSDEERTKISKILQSSQEAKEQLQKA